MNTKNIKTKQNKGIPLNMNQTIPPIDLTTMI